MNDRQITSIDVRVLLLRGSDVLLIQRSDPLFNGYWNHPGGHVMAAEGALTAAGRELEEEAGVTVKPFQLRFVGACHYRITDRGPKVGLAFAAHRWIGNTPRRRAGQVLSFGLAPDPRPAKPNHSSGHGATAHIPSRSNVLCPRLGHGFTGSMQSFELVSHFLTPYGEILPANCRAEPAEHLDTKGICRFGHSRGRHLRDRQD